MWVVGDLEVFTMFGAEVLEQKRFLLSISEWTVQAWERAITEICLGLSAKGQNIVNQFSSMKEDEFLKYFDELK